MITRGRAGRHPVKCRKEKKNKTKFYLRINLLTSQQGVLNFLLCGVQRAAVMKTSIEQKRKCSPLEDVKLFYIL